MRISDWSSDVCSSDLRHDGAPRRRPVNLLQDSPLPWPQLHRLPHQAPLWHPAIFLDPADIPVGARQLATCHGFKSPPAFFAAVPADCGVYRDWFVSRSLVALSPIALVDRKSVV